MASELHGHGHLTDELELSDALGLCPPGTALLLDEEPLLPRHLQDVVVDTEADEGCRASGRRVETCRRPPVVQDRHPAAPGRDLLQRR